MSRRGPGPIPTNDNSPGIDPAELGRVRAYVKLHIEATGTLDGLDIAPNAPPPGMKFAFVHPAPKLKLISGIVEHSLWRRCSYCETDNKFIDGSIVWCADGKLRLIGPECWKDQISVHDWEAAQADFRQHERIERFKVARDRYFPAARALQGEIRDARSQAKLIIIYADQFWATFRQRFPSLAAQLQTAHSHDDQLMVERYKTNYSGLEGARGQAAADRTGDYASRSYVPERLHTILGSAVIDGRMQIASRAFDRAFLKINGATALIEQDWEARTDAQFDKTASEFETLCRDAVEAVSEALRYMNAISVFMSPANITGLVKWANDIDCELCLADDAGRFVALNDGVALEPERGDSVEHRMLKGYSVPRLAHLGQMSDLLSKHGIGKRQRAA